MNDILFEIREEIGVLREYGNGWKRELNMVAWNGAEPKFDIRDWNPEHTYMSRGITLSEAEAEAVYERLGRKFEVID